MLVSLHKRYVDVTKPLEELPDLDDTFNLSRQIFLDSQEPYSAVADCSIIHPSEAIKEKMVINCRVGMPLIFGDSYSRYRNR